MKCSANRKSGFTLVELTMSVGLLGVIFGAAAMVSSSGRDAFLTTSSKTELEAKARQTLDRIVVEVEMASSGTLDPQLTGLINDTDVISLQQVVDIVGGVPVFGDILGIGFQDDPLDVVDGFDNDGDGLIDEGRVVLIRDFGGPNEITVTLCKNVGRFLEGESAGAPDENGNGLNNEAGFLIQRDGDLLTLQLTLEGRMPNGGVRLVTNTTSVLLEN